MADHILFNEAAGSAYLKFPIGSQNDVYLEVTGMIPASSLVNMYSWLGTPGPFLMGVLDLDVNFTCSDQLFLADPTFAGSYNAIEDLQYGAQTGSSPTGGVNFTLKMFMRRLTSVGQYIAFNADVQTIDDSGCGPWRNIAVGLSTADRFGQHSGGNDAIPGGATFQVFTIKAGTTDGAHDLLNFDASTATNLSAFTLGGSGSTTLVKSASGAKEGIRIAFGSNAFDLTPAFIRVDDPNVPPLSFDPTSKNAHNVTAWTIDRGRSYELDKTQAGTATLTVFDKSGIFDPTNAASPYYGLIGPMQQAKIGVQNRFTGAYTDLFSGFLESYAWSMTSDEKLMTVQIGLVDGFEPLTRCEIPPDIDEGTTTFLGTSDVQTRIDALLDIANWPVGTPWRKINTGNVFLQQTVYNVQTSVLSAIQDAADAEFPGVANFFMNKDGGAAFYGRYPRFQPTNYPDDVNFWICADRGGQAVAPTAALITDIEWALDQKNLINACLCYQYGIAQSLIPGQLIDDPVSIAQFGNRTLSLPDLIEDGQPSGGGISPQPALTAAEVAQTYAQYYVDNYAQPQLRVSKISFSSLTAASSETIAFMLGVEIGDIITLYVSNPGGGGFGKGTGGEESPTPAQFFVEGIHYTATVEGDHGQDIELSLDLSPRGWFIIDPWAG